MKYLFYYSRLLVTNHSSYKLQLLTPDSNKITVYTQTTNNKTHTKFVEDL